MTYEDEINAFIKKADRERADVNRELEKTPYGSPECVRLTREVHSLYRKHMKEFRAIREKYNLPPPPKNCR